MLGHSGAGESGADERNGVNGMKADFRKTMEALDSVSTEKLLSCAHSCPPPDRRKIVRVIKDFQAVLFPLCFRRDVPDESSHPEKSVSYPQSALCERCERDVPRSHS